MVYNVAWLVSSVGLGVDAPRPGTRREGEGILLRWVGFFAALRMTGWALRMTVWALRMTVWALRMTGWAE